MKHFALCDGIGEEICDGCRRLCSREDNRVAAGTPGQAKVPVPDGPTCTYFLADPMAPLPKRVRS